MTQERTTEMLKKCLNFIKGYNDDPKEIVKKLGFTKEELGELGFEYLFDEVYTVYLYVETVEFKEFSNRADAVRFCIDNGWDEVIEDSTGETVYSSDDDDE